MLADLRYSLRNFRANPGFIAIAVLVLALGIGANAAIFSVVNATLLHALAFRDPDRLVMIWEKNPQLSDMLAERVPTCLKNYFAWIDGSKSFEGLGVFQSEMFTVTGGDKPDRMEGARVSSDLPAMFGVHPVVGRMFTTAECEPGRDRVAVISHSYYERRFGAKPAALGSTIRLSGDDYKVIGVWPADFHMPAVWGGLDQKKPDVWLPLNMRRDQPKAQPGSNRDKFVYARLKPGGDAAAGARRDDGDRKAAGTGVSGCEQGIQRERVSARGRGWSVPTCAATFCCCRARWDSFY